MSERKEAWMRILVAIVSGIILCLWSYVICALIVVNFIVTAVRGKRIKDLANFCEIWNTQVYVFTRYLSFTSNVRPMPFTSLAKNMSSFE
jgi:sorbitol-specific phosphotransferase system component IIC